MGNRRVFHLTRSWWRDDPGLSLCSEGARLLWFEMILLMADGEERGFLAVAGRTPTMREIAVLTRTDPACVVGRLSELERNGVLRRDKRGMVFCRRLRGARPGRLPWSAWARLRSLVFARDGRRCAYCSTEAGPFEIDHRLPISRGGTNDPDNLAVACFGCNRGKRDKTPNEWLGAPGLAEQPGDH